MGEFVASGKNDRGNVDVETINNLQKKMLDTVL